MQIKAITRDIFYKKKNAIPIRYEKENTGATQKKGLLKIVCKDSIIRFQDIDSEENMDFRREYTYLGMWKDFGMHIVIKYGFEHVNS